ncbi:MAG TPA: HEAT repeat domain-containing protein [Longimicrobium sp.]
MNGPNVIAAALILAAGSAHAQDAISRRVDAAPDGEVRISFAARPDVCGWQEGISTRGSRVTQGTRTVRDGNWSTSGETECLKGPVRVTLVKRDGRVTDVRTRVAYPFQARGGRVTDLGMLDPREASAYLLSLAERTPDGGVGKDLIFPATIAEGAESWPALLRIARREGIPRDTRQSAVFWLSQEASESATQGLQEIVDATGDQGMRKHAVFALSQRPGEEAVPALIRIARTHRDPELRRTAIFWLGQSRDPRALALFEEILLR